MVEINWKLLLLVGALEKKKQKEVCVYKKNLTEKVFELFER